MDQIVADVTSIPAVHEQDEVVLIGSQGEERIRAEEVAAWAGTINYEVTTSLLPRLPRVYIRDGQIVEVIRLTTPG
jgi:alanine racemase